MNSKLSSCLAFPNRSLRTRRQQSSGIPKQEFENEETTEFWHSQTGVWERVEIIKYEEK